MILVDTSVWVRALMGRAPYAAAAAELVAGGRAAAHEFVHGELQMGDRGGRAEFLARLRQAPVAPTVPHLEVEALVRVRRLQGRGIGWVDAHLLASALAHRHRLWTADEALAAIAAEVGVGWNPGTGMGGRVR